MNIIYVCNEYPPSAYGGIGIFVRNLASGLVRRGHKVTVVGFAPEVNKLQRTEEDQIDVVRLPRLKRTTAIAIGRYTLDPNILRERIVLSHTVQALAKELRPDIIESYDWSGPLWHKPYQPLVVRLHGANTAYAVYEGKKPSMLLRYLEKRNVEMADSLVAVSRHIGDVTLPALKLPNRTFTTIYNGVDTAFFSPRSLQQNAKEILYVGRLHARKGIFELFDALYLVFKAMPDVTVTLAGRLPEGEIGHRLKQDLLSRLDAKMAERVHFVGHVDHSSLPEYYSRAAVAVFPSRAEAFGLTCAEAMSCATPVVMTRHASGPELIESGVSGLLADPANAAELAEAITSILRDRAFAHRLGLAARERVLQHFDQNKLVEKNLSFYERVIHG